MVDTPATRAAAEAGMNAQVVVTEVPRSVEESAALQGIDVGRVLRTIVVRRGAGDFVFVLVPGGRQIDWKKLRTHLGRRRISLPDADEAKAVTGYERGAITPFGATTAWPVLADATIRGLGTVAIGAGARGVNLHVGDADLLTALAADEADVTNPTDSAGDPGVATPSDA
ncbi:MAG: YbaK/EbsC family protein [Thermoleophilia bacterium]|nr:YbaK/EbsC family protein [Actinomycetota bacterium]MDH5224052.1 YbaK/EbsC family protein [Actinomycetota bacterium]MDH5280015.1 YbaK/EbsC family protein [Thermoleophilia bacterium]